MKAHFAYCLLAIFAGTIVVGCATTASDNTQDSSRSAVVFFRIQGPVSASGQVTLYDAAKSNLFAAPVRNHVALVHLDPGEYRVLDYIAGPTTYSLRKRFSVNAMDTGRILYCGDLVFTRVGVLIPLFSVAVQSDQTSALSSIRSLTRQTTAVIDRTSLLDDMQ
jgi:hypothetical protein